MFDIPLKKRKIFCYPRYIIDLCVVRVCLEGNRIFLDRFQPSIAMVLQEEPTGHLEDFEEVDTQEFLEIAQKHASKESLEAFYKEWDSHYGRR